MPLSVRWDRCQLPILPITPLLCPGTSVPAPSLHRSALWPAPTALRPALRSVIIKWCATSQQIDQQCADRGGEKVPNDPGGHRELIVVVGEVIEGEAVTPFSGHVPTSIGK